MTEPTNTYNQNSYEQELNSFVNNGYDNYDSGEYYDAEGDDDDLYEEDGDGEEYQVVSKFGGEVDQEQEEGEDDYIYGIDFSQFNGSDFKSSLNGVNRTVNRNRSQRTPVKRVIVPKGTKKSCTDKRKSEKNG